MRDWAKTGLVFAFVAAFAGTILCFQIANYAAVERLTQTMERMDAVSTMTSQWMSGGVQRTCTTTRQEGESAEDFARRHQLEVDAMLVLFPKDP